ncbi:hypothetical protein [Rhodohalobacter sp.]|nr:hypothetical protein [Rhodohalobacter sp.]MDZ7754848.1 hypothetical protein [Rhodohalobacter sp.]
MNSKAEKKGAANSSIKKELLIFYAFSNRFKDLQKQLDEWYSLKIEAE